MAEGTAMNRHLMISADCHAAPRLDEAREYVDPAFRGAFDEWRSGLNRRSAARGEEPLFDDEASDSFRRSTAETETGMDGIWDSARRLRELDADGVVAEVIFPGGATTPDGEAGSLPFDVGISTYQYRQDAARWQAGVRAYNRWLADFCALVPGRRAGVGLITVEDVDAAVEEVTWLREHEVFGGILLPGGAIGIGDLPPAYNDPRYEPLWAVCADLDMPVHTHSGWTPEFGSFEGSLGIWLHEIVWWAHRPFWFMVWSGVFERHPALKLVFTEQKAAWIIPTLEELDGQYGRPMFRHLRSSLPLKPSEYYQRQCFMGASFVDDHEWDKRYEIGVEKLMWGTDYPHLEGWWPDTDHRLKRTFGDMPRSEVESILGRTALAVYGFDEPLLRPLAERHGAPLDAFGR
ncbi:amidohydrolase [Myxococcota bacterium]|nr:amidohydrolase [Myxococcota bacterium]